MRPRWPLLLAVLALLQAPWLSRAVDFDEANFLVLARGAAADPWRPHDVLINWQGRTERAFDVLSNPPGIAWWLAPLHNAPIELQRAWMLPWLALALFGARRLGRRFLDDADFGALVLLTSPIVLLSTVSLLPDAPLYACTLAGVGGFVGAIDRGGRGAVAWAFLAGCAGLFRYSGVCLAPLLALYALQRGRPPWAAFAAWAPLGLLALHDEAAYGAWHLVAMGQFQSVSNTPADWLHKGAAILTMLGGAAALPLFPWTWTTLAGGAVGAALASPFGLIAAGFGALGGASLATGLGPALASGRRSYIGPAVGPVPTDLRADRRWLAVWILGGVVFLLTLRFMAARYWLPFLAPVLLSLPVRRFPRLYLALSLSLGVLLEADAFTQARAVERLANEVAHLGQGLYTGHWGWQWEMEAHGWRAVDEGTRVPPDTLIAMPHQAWPQPVDVACVTVVWEGAARPPLPWLPRGYSERGRANLHANWIADQPPHRTVIPWTFANDAYERVRVCRD